MKKMRIPIFCIVAALTMLSCNKTEDKEVIGLKPVYTSVETVQRIVVDKNESLDKPGKIYVYENYILVNDQAKGIHIYNNSNTASPEHVSFISIPGNMDFSVRNNMLYADNITDLAVIDISDPSNPAFINRIEAVFPMENSPSQQGSFECVDPSKGIVLRWETALLINPKCSK